MDKLQKARETINQADKAMAELFQKRMEAVKEVAEYKKERGLPVLDAHREAEVIARNIALLEDESLRSYYRLFLERNMEISKRYQHSLMEGTQVAYSGVEGAFAHIAASRIFPDGMKIAHHDFESAYQSVVNGECDYAVLPLENSYAGEVGQVMDLLYSGPLYVSGIYDLRISQNLLGIPGAKIEDVKTVISHPQAFSQCSGYIQKHGYQAVQAVNTARAAQEVAEKGDKTVAAIASAETASLYGLSLLDHDINESTINTTRFAVFSRVENTERSSNNTFLLLFTVNNVAGALAKAVSVIGKHGFNMRVLRSRPVKDTAWQYYFYVEAEGDESSEHGKAMLQELQEHCDKLKIVGRYANEIQL